MMMTDNFRFYAYNAQCQRIFLACSHDNGYIAELDKYRHDAITMPKVMLVHAAQSPSAAKAYAGLPFKSTRFDTVFESTPLEVTSKAESAHTTTDVERPSLDSSPAEQTLNGLTRTVSRSSHASTPGPPSVTPLTPLVLNTRTTPPTGSHTPPAEFPKAPPSNPVQAHAPSGGTEARSGIPINRSGQRIDLKLRLPLSTEMEKFEDRIYRRKLCNEHHLRDNCESYNCKYDHDPIDASMKNTLRYKARSIPCAQGAKCRRQDCFYGHQCPWGNSNCANPKCSFSKSGLHDIKDLEVARFVPAQPMA